jgi:hypothetical protein
MQSKLVGSIFSLAEYVQHIHWGYVDHIQVGVSYSVEVCFKSNLRRGLFGTFKSERQAGSFE